ncbi:hypothetical protein J437_LFUL019564 [Ladona fulva]|nr:hypothetical protein J437_LFUL019564 [Ladona fulva]
MEMEIMINSPPAPSVESLALAHLRDGEDSPIPPPTSPSPAPSADSQDGILENSEKDKNEISQSLPVRKTSGAPTPPTDGSQCSSSCSTVVNPSNSSNPAEATSTTPAPTRVGSAHSSCSQRSGHSLLSLAKSSSGAPTSPNCHGRITPHRHQNRRASPGSGHIVTHPHIRTASDLSVGTCSTGSEIGFGHTAQNSVSSSPGDVGNCGSESNAGESSESDVRVSEKKDSEEKSEEVPSPQLEEQNLDYSVQSAHSYGCPPRRRSTVSSTLDTDSDYVRLPLRPITSFSDSDSFLASSPTPPPPPPRDESSGAKVGSYVYLDHTPRPISMGCVTTITQAADEVDGRLIMGPSFSPRPPPPPPPVTSMTTSEANARFITTRPNINILTAHTSTAPAVASPSFAAPTAAQQQLRAYPPGDARTHPPAVHPRPPQLLPSPVVARGLAVQHRTSPHRHLSIGSTGCAEELAAKMKPTVSSSGHSPILPVIGPNNYLDVHASKVMANHRHNHHHHQQHPKQRSGLLRGTIQSPKKSHQVSRGHPVSPVVSPLPSPLMAHQPRQQPTYLCGPTTCGVAHRHHRHQHHHHHAPCMTHHTVSHNGGSPGSVSPAAPQPSLATVYTNQVTQSQIEQYKQQLYSDVDYVIYPMKDPALSKQEYMDAKQGSTLMAHLQQQQYNSHHHHHHFHGGYPTVIQPPPPPYRGPTKSGILYRSTPNVSGGTVTGTYGVQVHHPANGIPFSQHRIVTAPKYASNQNLSCGGGSSASTSTNSTVNSYLSEMAPFPGLRPFLSTQSLALTPAPAYSFYSASTQNLTRGMYEQQQHTLPPPPPPIPKGGGEFMQVSIPTLPTLAGHLEFGRTRSDDNILNIDKQQGTITGRQYYRLPPPPPYDPSVNASNVSVNGNPAPESSPQVSVPQQSPSSSSSDETKKADGMLDIRTLREKSKNLDLPLISALCNDRSLLKQTNAFVAHPTHREGEGTAFVAEAESQRHKGRPVSWHVEGSMVPGNANNSPAEAPIPTPSVVETAPQPNSSSTSQTQSPSPSIQETHKPRISRGHLSDLKIGGAVSPNGPVGSCSTNLAAFTKSSKHSYSVSPSKKYPVSGLSTTQISKPQRKVSSCTHTHPQDPRVVLVPGVTTLGATPGSASVVMAGLKGPASATKTRIGLKQKANVVP